MSRDAHCGGICHSEADREKSVSHVSHISHTSLALGISLLLACLSSCRGPELVVPSEYELLPIDIRSIESFADDEPIGMYILNEANMGSNKASIDYVDFCNGYYVRSIYTEKNPNVIKELGDVGNDIQVYGNRLYAVINCSHKVEVMDLKSCVRIGQVDIPNCRYIRFREGMAYVSSYVGPVSIDPNAQLGAVYEVDTTTLKITRKVTVGYQPDELEIIGDYIYVANSGGYRVPNYDSTLSVVEIYGMKQTRKIPVGINLHRVRKDRYDRLWVSSRGDYETVPSRMFVLERLSKFDQDYQVTDTIDIPCSEMTIVGDSMYFYAVNWSQQEETNHISYGIIDVRDKRLLTDHLITDGTEKDITVPYGIAVNPYNGDIYLTDAKNYVSSGVIYCYDKNGKQKWHCRTGDIPAHLCFVYK